MRVTTTTLAFILAVASVSLFAAESSNSSRTATRHQLSDCMSKRMYSDKTLSYNDAAKACKDELQGSKTDALLSKMPKPVG